jgi:hypothetical protein
LLGILGGVTFTNSQLYKQRSYGAAGMPAIRTGMVRG